MTINLKKLAGASILVLAAMGSAPAFAAGADTNAGVVITNTATINFQVGGVAQTAVDAVNTLTVDRKVLFTVAEVNAAYTSVVPGQNGGVSAFNAAATTFTITNNTNDVLDFDLSATDETGAGPFGGTDNFNPSGTSYTYYRDDGNGVFDAADTLITYVDELGEDASVTIHVVNDIAITQVNGDLAVVSLTATAHEGGTALSKGTALTDDSGATNVEDDIDNVFADAAGTDDIAEDGKHSARDGYEVDAPVLTVNKIVRVIEDPINTIASGNAANAKMIPGATVEYCITVANASGAAAATSVVITDALPAATTYVSAFGVYEGGSVTGGVCSSGTNTGSQAAGTVTGTLGTVAAGATETVYFRATIN